MLVFAWGFGLVSHDQCSVTVVLLPVRVIKVLLSSLLASTLNAKP